MPTAAKSLKAPRQHHDDTERPLVGRRHVPEPGGVAAPVDCEAPRSSHRESQGHEPGVKPRTTRRVVHAIPFNSESGREPRASAVGGYAVLEAKSRDEALHAARTFMRLRQQHWPGWEGECEIRQ